MTTLKIGIASKNFTRQRTIDIAAGRYKPSEDEPKVWFPSLESLAKILSEENRAILTAIKEHHPDSVSALADLVGRAQSNLTRTLKTMELYGIVEFRKEGRKSVPIVRYDEFTFTVAA